MHTTESPAWRGRSLLGVLTVVTAILSGCGGAATTASATIAAQGGIPTTAVTASPSPAPTPAYPAGWTRHVSTSGVLSFSYDPAWNLAECDPGVQYSGFTAAGPGTAIFLGLTAQQQFHECPEEDESPQVLIQSTPGTPPRSSPSPFPCAGPAQSTSTAVTVQGVSGVREEWHYTGAYRCIGTSAISEVEYVFATDGRVYDFDYTYRQGDGADLTVEFDQLVTSTMAFSAS